MAEPAGPQQGRGFFAAILALNVVMFAAITLFEYRAFAIAQLSGHHADEAIAIAAPESGSGDDLHRAAGALARRMFADGRAAFGRCALCHGLEDAAPNFGPNLTCVGGRAVASNEDQLNEAYRFSKELKRLAQDAGVWTLPMLHAFAEAPERVRPGTRMPFPGLGADRADAATSDPARAKLLRDVVQHLYWRCAPIADFDDLRVIRLDGEGGCSADTAADGLPALTTAAERELNRDALYRAFAADASLYLSPYPLPECGSGG